MNFMNKFRKERTFSEGTKIAPFIYIYIKQS